MHRKGKVAVILLICALILSAAALFVCSRFLVIGGKVCNVNAQTLDLSGCTLGDTDGFSRMQQLRQLDLRNTGLTTAQYTQIRQALPQCEIAWDIPFQGNYLDEDATCVAVAPFTSEDLDTLAFFSRLDTIDATACTDPGMIAALQARYPQAQVLYRLTLENIQVDETTTQIALQNPESIAAALSCMPQLTRIDALECQDTAALQALQTQYPNCRLIYNLPLGAAAVPTNAESLTLESITAAELAQLLPYFYNLQSVEIQQPIPDYTLLLELAQQYPEIDFTYSFSLLGVTVCSWDTAIDLSGIPMENTAAVESALPHFRNLEKVDMSHCGIANEDMAALNQRHPDTLFVWTVQIGRAQVKTDVTYFQPRLYGISLHEEDTENLKYLTELICLDLGHQDVSSSDYLQYMTKMQYLIVVDTDITDISGCANMPDLKFAEFYVTGITDFSPLLACKKLEDLNIGYCHPDDWTLLLEMKQLTRLYWCGMHNGERKQALREALPNTILMFDGVSSTGNGWRECPNYYAMRDLMGLSYMTY